MSEIILPIDTINPVILWGANQENFEILKKSFPKLKLVTRGNMLKVIGEEKEIENFSNKFELLIQKAETNNVIMTSDIETIFNKKINAEKKEADSGLIDSNLNNEALVFGPNGIVVKARTANQRRMVQSTVNNDIIFAVGPAGTGKTYTAVALAVRALRNKEIKRIILTRPAVEAGENLGFLPGDMKEKIDPYLRPLYDALDDMIPADKLKTYLENRTIEIAPLAFMRGRTLDHAFVILDEAQNATELQLKMFLSRMGPSAKFLVTGDITQIDLPKKQMSGLFTALRILQDIKGIEIIYLTGEDVVRHKLVVKILQAYGDIQ